MEQVFLYVKKVFFPTDVIKLPWKPKGSFTTYEHMMLSIFKGTPKNLFKIQLVHSIFRMIDTSL